MKIAFFGTPEFAWNIFSWILEYPEIEVVLVVSQPDRAVWRKKEFFSTPVKRIALDVWIEVLQPEKIKKNSEFHQYLKNLNLDFIVVVAYGKIIPQAILDIPKHGCINIHGSILPAYRGASPVQAAIRDWLLQTWLTTMYMSAGMDEWDMLKVAEVDIDNVDTSEDIFKKFVHIWPKLLIDTLKEIISGNLKWTSQDHNQATHCGKISREEGEVFFSKQSAQEIYNTFRAYTPWPGIYSWYEGKRLVLEEVSIYKKPDLWISSPQGEEGYSLRQWYIVVPDYVKELSKNLRQGQTDLEKIVWEMLRNRKFHGLKFRRQHTVWRYIADFYCDEKKIVIELDWKVHENQEEYDAIRDEFISSHNIHIIRVLNEDISKIYSIIYSELCSLSLLWGERIQEWGFEWTPWQFIKLSKNTYGIVCADKKILEVTRVKLEGKKSMDTMSFVNGNTEIIWYQFK
jgi:methionyl-tRNA formyltransferase